MLRFALWELVVVQHMTTRGKHRPAAAVDFPALSPWVFSSPKVPSVPAEKTPKDLKSSPGEMAQNRW